MCIRDRKKVLLIPVFIFFFLSGKLFGQTSASANFTASATIIQPIGITTTSNMNFAGIDARSGGAVTLTPENTRTISGGVALADGATVSAAAFEITGEAGFAFNINLPEGEYVLSNGSENMIIGEFTSSLAAGGNLDAGSKTIRVGATLKVSPNQRPGVYDSTSPMTITVAYN